MAELLVEVARKSEMAAQALLVPPEEVAAVAEVAAPADPVVTGELPVPVTVTVAPVEAPEPVVDRVAPADVPCAAVPELQAAASESQKSAATAASDG
jgi:hypothetical protein